MQELVRKINDGRYKVTATDEPVYIETCLFLLECLQTVEENRITVDALDTTPFIAAEFSEYRLHEVNRASFKSEQRGRQDSSDDYNTSQGSAMLSRFDEDEVEDSDVILTARRSQMREILIQ